MVVTGGSCRRARLLGLFAEAVDAVVLGWLLLLLLAVVVAGLDAAGSEWDRASLRARLGLEVDPDWCRSVSVTRSGGVGNGGTVMAAATARAAWRRLANGRAGRGAMTALAVAEAGGWEGG